MRAGRRTGGARRLRWLFVAGWALYVASFMLPVVGFVFHPPGGMTPRYGYEIFGLALRAGIPVVLAAVVSNGSMLMTLLEAAGARVLPKRWLARLVGLLGLFGIVVGAVFAVGGGVPITVNDGPAYHRHLGFGFWAWVLSFACVAAALRLRDRGPAMAGTDAPTA